MTSCLANPLVVTMLRDFSVTVDTIISVYVRRQRASNFCTSVFPRRENGKNPVSESF